MKKVIGFLSRLNNLKKVKKKTLWMILSGLVICSLIAGLLIYLLPKTAEAAWWNEDWHYRVPLPITNAGSALTDYQVQITLNTSSLISASKMQSSCNDLRITDINGKVLPYWIETGTNACNSTTTAIWTKVPSIPSSGTTLYIYYGNTTAINDQNGNDVFLFFDDFSGSALDMQKWQIPLNQGSYALSSGIMTMTVNVAATTQVIGQNPVNYPLFSGDYEVIIRSQAMSGLTTGNHAQIGLSSNGTKPSGCDLAMVDETGNYDFSNDSNCIVYSYIDNLTGASNGGHAGNGFGVEANNNSRTLVKTVNLDGSAYHVYKFKKAGTTAYIYTDGALTTSVSTNVPSASLGVMFGATLYDGFSGTLNTRVDFVGARKAAATEPVVGAAGTEEKAQGPVLDFRFNEGSGVITRSSNMVTGGTTTNMVLNPSLETNTNNWTTSTGTGATISRDSTKAAFGQYSLKSVYVVGSPNYHVWYAGMNWNTNAASSGQTWTGSINYYVESASGGAVASIKVEAFNNIGGSLGLAQGNFNMATGKWQKVSVSYTMPASTAYAVLTFTQATANSTVYLDGAQLEQTSFYTPYCDGSLPGPGARSWSGTVHASSSTCTFYNYVGEASGPSWVNDNMCINEKCLYFDGTGDNVYALGYNSIKTPNVTVEAWVRVLAVDSSGGEIVSMGDTYSLRIDNTNGKPYFTVYNGSTWASVQSGINILDQRWHHVVGIKDTVNNQIKIYVDGNETTAANSYTLSYALGPNFVIGKHGNGSTNNDLKGFIDDVKVYDFAKAAIQVKADFVSRGAVDGVSVSVGGSDQKYLSDGLVGYWKMDESSGNASDSSGNGTMLIDGSTITYSGAKYGNGGDFERTSSNYLYTNDNAALSITGDLTLAGWIKPESVTASTQFNIAGKWDGTNEAYLLAQYEDEIRMYIDSSSSYVTTTAANLTPGTWYHVIGTFSASTQTVLIYINGTKQATSTTGTIPSSIADDTSRFQISGVIGSSNTLDLQPVVGGDDYLFSPDLGGVFGNNQTETSVGNDGSYQYHTGIRFPNVSIPNSATITSAYVTFVARSNVSTTTVNTNLYLNNVDNATAPTNYTQAATLALTSAVAWNNIGAWTQGLNYQSPSITSIVQSVINRPGWQSGYALQVLWKNNNSSTSARRIYANLEHITYNPPILHIEYGTYSDSYDGLIDDVRVYNRALSPKEVSGLYNFAPGPITYWNLDENSGNIVNDRSGYGNISSTFTGNPVWQPGKYGSSLYFDGTNSVVRIPETTYTDLGALTGST